MELALVVQAGLVLFVHQFVVVQFVLLVLFGALFYFCNFAKHSLELERSPPLFCE